MVATAFDVERVRETLVDVQNMPDRTTELAPSMWVLRRHIEAMLPYAALRREQLPDDNPEPIARLDEAMKSAKALGAMKRPAFLATAPTRRQQYLVLAEQLLKYTEDAVEQDREECRPW
ncbi:hypothetical protein ACFYOD_18445 [Streptomyces sp. NPDC006703]|uniref:hypothetical protein n=1 Tax=Streptomyces sp. NPDC006703 TaxID=3364759 RepID=UPI0036BA0651